MSNPDNPLRCIKTFTAGDVKCRVYRDEEWEEYRCRLSVGGRTRVKTDYHTDDKADAIATARVMCAQAAGRYVFATFDGATLMSTEEFTDRASAIAAMGNGRVMYLPTPAEQVIGRRDQSEDR